MSLKTLIRIASAFFALAALSAAGLAWFGLDVVEASVSLTPTTAVSPTRDLLDSTQQTVSELRTTLGVVSRTTDDVATSTDDLIDTLGGVTDVLENQIPPALTAVQSSLPALIDTAAVVDQSMRALARLGVPYNPQVPFDQALAQVQLQLEGLPQAIEEQGANIDALLPVIRRSGQNMGDLTGRIHEIEASLGDAQTALVGYETTLNDFETASDRAAELVSFVPVARLGAIILALASLAVSGAAWLASDRSVIVER